jgi:hypothetical protein
MSDEKLHARRAQYGRETSQAPVHADRELRLARQARDQAAERMMRSRLEAGVAADPAAEARHRENDALWTAVRDRSAAAHYEAAIQIREVSNSIAEPTFLIEPVEDEPHGQRPVSDALSRLGDDG